MNLLFSKCITEKKEKIYMYRVENIRFGGNEPLFRALEKACA